MMVCSNTLPSKFTIEPSGLIVRALIPVTYPLPLVNGILDISVLAIFLGQNLNAEVIVLVRAKAATIIPVDLTEEDDRRCARRFGFAGHLQLFLRNRLKSNARTSRVRAKHYSGQNDPQ